MDQNELQQKIALYYSKLPPKAQEMFSSMNWLETLKTISQKYGLSEEQKQALGTETTLVLLGIIHLDEYREILKKELALLKESADEMVEEVNKTILEPVRGELMDTFRANIAQETQETGEESEIESDLDKRLEKLPKEILDAVIRSNYQATLYDIAKEYNLNVEQMGVLEKIVTGLIVGAIHANDFKDVLGDSVNLSEDKIVKLTNDINEKILKPIREKLMNLPKAESQKSEIPLPKSTPTAQISKEDTAVLKSHGIEIVPEKLELTTSEKPHPILTQKLSGSFKIPTVTTEHSNSGDLSKLATPVPAPKTYPKGADPYRLSPDE